MFAKPSPLVWWTPPTSSKDRKLWSTFVIVVLSFKNTPLDGDGDGSGGGQSGLVVVGTVLNDPLRWGNVFRKWENRWNSPSPPFSISDFGMKTARFTLIFIDRAWNRKRMNLMQKIYTNGFLEIIYSKDFMAMPRWVGFDSGSIAACINIIWASSWRMLKTSTPGPRQKETRSHLTV